MTPDVACSATRWNTRVHLAPTPRVDEEIATFFEGLASRQKSLGPEVQGALSKNIKRLFQTDTALPTIATPNGSGESLREVPDTIKIVLEEMIAVAAGEDEGNLQEWTSSNRAQVDNWQVRLFKATRMYVDMLVELGLLETRANRLTDDLTDEQLRHGRTAKSARVEVGRLRKALEDIAGMPPGSKSAYSKFYTCVDTARAALRDSHLGTTETESDDGSITYGPR